MQHNVETGKCHFEDYECKNSVSHVVVYKQSVNEVTLTECHWGYCESHIEEALDFLGDRGDCYSIGEWDIQYEIHKLQQEQMT